MLEAILSSNAPDEIKQFAKTHLPNRTQDYTKSFQNGEDIVNSDLNILPFEMPNFPTDTIANEAKSLIDRYVEHRSMISRGWKSIVLHGLGWDKTRNYTSYGYDESTPNRDIPYDWTEIADLCHTAKEYFRSFGYKKYHRIRFMLLEPGGYILPHNDSNISKLHALNIALTQPKDCWFLMEGVGNLPFEPGVGIFLNLKNQHCIYNASSENRLHMIVHGNMGNNIFNFIHRQYENLQK